jgi:pyruvate,water dikinase
VSDKLCMWLCEAARDSVPLAGGKGANLGDMIQAGLPVPDGYVITAPAYRQLVETADLVDKIDDLLLDLDRNDCEALQKIEPQIRALFTRVTIPAEMERTIVEHYRQLGADVPVAVRSSATAEDLAGASFAGQQETFLNVAGEEALLNAVRNCWSSLFTAQAIFYRCQRGFEDREVSMGVVVQKMLNPEKSGVSFTVDPVLRNRTQMIIEGVWGLGEGIVSGEITPDHYKLDRETCEIVFEFVPDKITMFCRDRAGGVTRQPVPAEKVSARVLSDDELRQLVKLGNQIEEHFGCPQDIEWGVEDGIIHLLQSRPITCL